MSSGTGFAGIAHGLLLWFLPWTHPAQMPGDIPEAPQLPHFACQDAAPYITWRRVVISEIQGTLCANSSAHKKGASQPPWLPLWASVTCLLAHCRKALMWYKSSAGLDTGPAWRVSAGSLRSWAVGESQPLLPHQATQRCCYMTHPGCPLRHLPGQKARPGHRS